MAFDCEICLESEATGLVNIDGNDNPNEWLATCGECAQPYLVAR